jgi:hypothetical protein
MSATASEEDEDARTTEDLCASCGIAEVDNIKWRNVMAATS